MRGVFRWFLIAAYCLGVGACSLVLDPSEHGAGADAGDGGANQPVDSGGQPDGSTPMDGGRDAEPGDGGDAGEPPDLTDGGDAGDASDPFVPPEGCEDLDVDEECLAIDCGPLDYPKDGKVVTPGGSTFGQVADYTCDEGFGVVGVSRRTCLANAEWSDEAPTCELGDCPTLVSPDNGVVTTLEGTVEGAEATYTCNLGYTLDGEPTRACLDDKTWSGRAPSCEWTDECEGANPCGEGDCINGGGFGYDCDCALGYEADGSAFPSCAAVPLLSLTGPSEYEFSSRELGTVSGYVDWVITNVGAAATGALELESEGEPDFDIDNGCDTSLEPGDDCTVRVRFSPNNYATVDETIRVSSDSTNEVSFHVRGTSQVRITVEISGTGSVTAEGIDCPGTCSALFDYASDVTLRAHTTNGSGHYLSRWSIDDCKGPSRDCVVWAGASRTVTATFSPMTHNLVFVTSASYAANFGSAAAYDAHCNDAASGAGINNASNDGYIAATSDEAGRYTTRLAGSVRGWVRLDGRPFAATVAALDSQILHPVRFDENGWDSDSWTWSGHESAADWSNCTNWTANTSDIRGWLGHSNSPRWNLFATQTCNEQYGLICLGNTQTAALDVVATAGKRIWLSSAYLPGTQTPDARCFEDRPSGVSNAVALIAYTDRTAASLLDPEADYVRPDGQLVGTGQELIDGQLYAGIWQLGSGSFNAGNTEVWTGSWALDELGASTCEDWTSSSMEHWGHLGESQGTLDRWWSDSITQVCGGFEQDYRLYCVEPI